MRRIDSLLDMSHRSLPGAVRRSARAFGRGERYVGSRVWLDGYVSFRPFISLSPSLLGTPSPTYELWVLLAISSLLQPQLRALVSSSSPPKTRSSPDPLPSLPPSLSLSSSHSSRLGCQVRLTPEIENLVATLPSATRNMFVDVSFPAFLLSLHPLSLAVPPPSPLTKPARR